MSQVFLRQANVAQEGTHIIIATIRAHAAQPSALPGQRMSTPRCMLPTVKERERAILPFVANEAGIALALKMT